MFHFMKPEEIANHLQDIPEELAILPLRNTVAYPFSVIPLAVGIPRSVKLVKEALETDSPIGLVAMKDPAIEEPEPGQIYETGMVVEIFRLPIQPRASPWSSAKADDGQSHTPTWEGKGG